MSAAPARRGGVAFLNKTFGWGGGERVLVEQVRALAPLGIPVDVWRTCPRRDGPIGEVARAANPNVRHVGVLRSGFAVARALWRARYDAVVTCSDRRAYRGIRYARRLPGFRGPVVHETVHARYGWGLSAFGGERVRAVDRWILDYDFRDALEHALGVESVATAVCRPLFADSLLALDDAAAARARALRISWGAGPDAVVLGYLGRLGDNKGLLQIVEVARRLVASGRDVRLVLAGRRCPELGDWDARLRGAVAEAEASDPRARGRFHVLGEVPSRTEVFAAFDATLLCSRDEGLFPLTLVESLSIGVPVVATDVGGIRTCLEDGVHAAIVAKVPDDDRDPTPEVVDAFEARVRALVDDPGLRRRLGDAGRERTHALVASNDFHGDFRRAMGLG
jgi:glycosyltransferase involved in cell wall biosynthesis